MSRSKCAEVGNGEHFTGRETVAEGSADDFAYGDREEELKTGDRNGITYCRGGRNNSRRTVLINQQTCRLATSSVAAVFINQPLRLAHHVRCPGLQKLLAYGL